MTSTCPKASAYNRVVEVRVRQTGQWRRVTWSPTGVTIVDGLPTVTGRWESREEESFWLEPDAVEEWREPAEAW